MRRIERELTGVMKPGQDLVMAGYAGWAGTVRAVKERQKELLTRYTKQYLNRILETEEVCLSSELNNWTWAGVTECEPAKEGGVYTALWNMSGVHMTGITFEQRKIPVRQATIEVCEFFDMNPYRLDSSNCLIFAADNGGDVVRVLEHQNIHGAVIGKVTKGIKRIIDHGEGQGYLDRPSQDEIYKIMNQIN